MQKQTTSFLILVGVILLILVSTCLAIIILSFNFQQALTEWESSQQMEEYSISITDDNIESIYVHVGDDHFYAESYSVFKDGTAVAIDISNAEHKIWNAKDVEIVIRYTES